MEPQIYKLETRFNFGKYKGKTLKDIVTNEPGYIGWLIFHDVSSFILEPNTLIYLENKGFFDDLWFSFPGTGGNLTFNEIGMSKAEIIAILNERYENYKFDPIGYEKLAIEKAKEFHKNKKL